MPLVTMPDGVVVDMPETLTPEQKTALEAKLSGGGFMRQAKLLGSNIIQGVAGLPALAMEAGEAATANIGPQAIARKLTGAPPIPYDPGARLAGVQGGAEALFGVKPETSNEKYVAAGTQGIAGGLVGPGSMVAPVRSAIAGLGGGVGAELSSRFLGDNALSRFMGGLAGGVTSATAANALGGVAPQVRRLATEAVEGLTPAMFSKAEAFMQKALAEGVKIDLAQALEAVGVPASNLTTIRNILANSKAGTQVQQTLREQPTQLKTTADLTMLSLPGTAKPGSEVANTVSKTATQVINNAKGARSAAVSPLYKAAGDLGPEVNRDFTEALMDARSAPGATQDVVNAVDRALAKLKAAPSTDAKMLHALDYDALISDLAGGFKGTPLTPADPKSAGQIKFVAGKLNEILQNASPQLKQAEGTYRQISRDVVDPLKQGPVGQLATKAGYKPDTQASAAKLEGFFSAGTDSNAIGRSDILTMARELNKVDKTAFPDAAKTYISGRLAKAFEPELGGVPGTSSDAAQRVWDQLFANSKQWQGMKDMAAGIADSHGLPRQDVVRGLENLAQITKALKSRPSSVGGLQSKEVAELAGGNYASNAARIFGFLPFERVARKIEDRTLVQTFGKFDEILTSPEGAQLLAKLGKRSALSPESLVMLSGFAGAVPQLDANPGQNMPR